MDMTLPAIVYVRRDSANGQHGNRVIAIKRGEIGYYPIDTLMTDEQMATRNNGATKAQIMAMKIGSMFGWEAHGAYAKNCE